QSVVQAPRAQPASALFPYTPLFRSRVEVRLQVAIAVHDLGVPGHDRRAPAGHVPALRQREELDPDLLGPGRLEIFSLSKGWNMRSEEHTSELQSRGHLVCRLLLEKT